MIEKCCAFTGHRPRKFPWGYNEADTKCVALKQALTREIVKLVEAGYTDFFSGMAEGTDTWASLAVLALKKGNPALKLHCVLPCEGQADEVVYVSREYSKDCMLKRNRYLVEHTTCLLAIYNGEWRGGTAMTVRYAKKLGRKIVIIAPSKDNCPLAQNMV